MQRPLIVLTVAVLLCGCTGKLEDQIASLESKQLALEERLKQMEAENHRLRTAAIRSATNTAASTTGAVATASTFSPDLARALAERINLMLQDKVGATVDEQLAARLGSQDDIEAIFTDAVEDALDTREEQERLDREQRRRDQVAAWDKRDIEQRAEAAGLDDEKREVVLLARQEMRERLRLQLPELKEQDATFDDMLAVVAEERTVFETELTETLSEEQVQAYYEADRWYQRQQGRVSEIAESAALNDEQAVLVDAAYTSMRQTIGDGFLLMGEGYAGRGDIRQNFSTSRDTFTQSLKAIMTPEQYETYEASDTGSRGRGFRGGMPF